jgi:hypothetical protein
MLFSIILIRIGVGITMLMFGIDQLRNPKIWIGYVPDAATDIVPTSPEKIMRFHSFGNITLGLFLISGWYPLFGAWVAFIWWLSILPFAFRIKWDVGMRDLSISACLLALIYLLSY